MADIQNENNEINEIITSIFNIPSIDADDSLDSTDEEDDEKMDPLPKRIRVNRPDASHHTTSQSFTNGTFSSSLQRANTAEQANGNTLDVERPSRSKSTSPKGSSQRTSSPTDELPIKDYYKNALIRESYTARVNFLGGNWLRQKAIHRHILAECEANEAKAAGLFPLPPTPHGKKRRSSESYDHSDFQSPTNPSSSQV